MRKIFILLAASILCFACKSGSDDTQVTKIAKQVHIGDLFYNLYDNYTAEVTYELNNYIPNDNYKSLQGTLAIPSSVEYEGKTYSVTGIGNEAFMYCSSLSAVTIPNSVTNFGYSIFRESSITSPVYNEHTFVYMPTSYSGAYAIKQGTKQIASNAFYDCINIQSISIPNSVTHIGDYAFHGCNNLTQPIYNEHVFAYLPKSYSGAYTIPEGIQEIAGGAFNGCKNLTSVTIPSSVTSIGNSAFENTALSEPIYTKHVFAYLPESYSGAYAIPQGITEIAAGAFSKCRNLTSVTVPNGVSNIGNAAFIFCTNLISVNIPNSVTNIGDAAFCYCYSLNSVTIPNGVSYIGEKTFYCCSGLTSVIIPNTVTYIEDNAFEGCRNLQITYAE